MRRRLLLALVAVSVVLALAPSGAGAAPARPSSTGEGRIFLTNAIVALRNDTITDRKDRDYAALQPAYSIHALTNLDGSGYLRGDFAVVRGSGGKAYSPDLRFLYGRHDPRFEQTMAYFAVTETQKYIQSLGFTDIQNGPLGVRVDQYGLDNSYYDTVKNTIRLGKGGVDDAEDLEVIWHEYGHAIQNAQIDRFGTNHDSNAIGEGFGDYWAATMSEPFSGGYGVACIAEWDSISYTPTRPFCLRRVDLDLTVADENGRIHHDGQIWSRALWDIHTALGRETADTIVLTAQYDFNPSTTFRDAALNTVEAARSIGGRRAANVARAAFEDRGIL